MATHSGILAWRIPWTEEPGRLQSMRSQRGGHDGSDLAHTQPFIEWKQRRDGKLLGWGQGGAGLPTQGAYQTLSHSRVFLILFHFQRRESQGRLVPLRLPRAAHSPRPCVETQTQSRGLRVRVSQAPPAAAPTGGVEERTGPGFTPVPTSLSRPGAVAYCFSPPRPGLECGALPCPANTQDSKIHPEVRRRPSVRKKKAIGGEPPTWWRGVKTCW